MLFPRNVGNPHQYWCKTERDFREFVNFNNGKHNCFWSHNAYGDSNAETIWVQTVPMDLDSKESLEAPYRDMVAAAELLERSGVPCLCVWTTNKGAHVYLCFKPMLVKNNSALRDYYKAVQNWVVENAQLTTFDKQVYGDTKRMMRIPGTIHPKTGKWCMAVNPKTPLPEILTACESRQPVVDFPEGKETLIEFCRRMGIKRAAGRKVNFTVGSFVAYDERKGDFDNYVRAVIPRVCIHNSLMTNNPPHRVRLEAALTLMKAGYDVLFAIEFMKKVSQHYHWENRDPNIQNYHLRWIYGRPDYGFHSCERLREEGLCIGQSCELFANAFPDEVTDASQN